MIYGGELQWSSIPYAHIMSAVDDNGDYFWSPHFQTEIGNSLRGVSFFILTSNPGVYSGVFDARSEKWSTPIISHITMNLDYDGVPYPTWRGQSATVTIHKFDRRSKRIDATIEAVMKMDGSTDTRNIRVEMHNLDVTGGH